MTKTLFNQRIVRINRINKSFRQLKSLIFRTLKIGLTVPEMDITGLYRINGEVFILPLEGGGSFTSKMSTVKATGFSTILPVITQEGKQVIIFNTIEYGQKQKCTLGHTS